MPITVNTSFLDSLGRVIRSADDSRTARACLLMTRDRDHALNSLKEAAGCHNQSLFHFTVAGRYRFNAAQLRWDVVSGELADAANLLRQARETTGSGIFVLEDCAQSLRDEGGNEQMRMMLADLISAAPGPNGKVLVFLEPPESERHLPSILADRIVRLEVPFPRAYELEAITRQELATVSHRSGKPRDIARIQLEASRLASGVVGLTRSAARDAVRDALVLDPNDIESAFQTLQLRKAVQLRRELAMNVLDTTNVELPVGLDLLIDYLMMAKSQMRVTGPERAKGTLIIGPPGTGKTMLARAIGKLMDLPVVEFRISALMNSLLGETERRFAQAFAVLEAMSPNIVFIDEIEKAFGDSTERDGGTMMRCTGALLSWLSDNPHPNFIVATSNSLKRMGEIGLTMTRSERFDASFFVDVPTRSARRQMLVNWLEPLTEQAHQLAEGLADSTDKFSGADLRSVVKLSAARAKQLTRPLTIDLLHEHVERKRLRATALYDEFQELRRWGRLYCDPASQVEP